MIGLRNRSRKFLIFGGIGALLLIGLLWRGTKLFAADGFEEPPEATLVVEQQCQPKPVCAGEDFTAIFRVDYPQNRHAGSSYSWTVEAERDGQPVAEPQKSQQANKMTITANYDAPGNYTFTVSVVVSNDNWNGPAIVTPPSVTVENTVVAVQKIQYSLLRNDFSVEWIDVPDPLYVLKGSQVTFKAVREPEGDEWPEGKPHWGGTSGASGTGPTTDVTFNELGTKTVSASSCGDEKTVTIEVTNFVGWHMAEDNFDGRSVSQYGVAEVVNLGFFADPPETTAQQLGGLRWEIVSGKGRLVRQPGNNGMGTYTCHDVAETVTLKLVVQGGPNQGQESRITFRVIPPLFGYCPRKPDWPVWHEQDTFSIGIALDFYLLPNRVSFRYLEFKEGFCGPETPGWETTGWFDDPYWNTASHPAWSEWVPISGGNSLTGCKVDFGNKYDYAWFRRRNPPPYADGKINLPIPWGYTADGGATSHQFDTMNQRATVKPNGDATIWKGGASGSNNHADPDSPWPGFNP